MGVQRWEYRDDRWSLSRWIGTKHPGGVQVEREQYGLLLRMRKGSEPAVRAVWSNLSYEELHAAHLSWRHAVAATLRKMRKLLRTMAE